MIRLVLDTNALVSALLRPDSIPAAVWMMVLSRRVQMCVSEPVFAEYEEVLRRPRFDFDPETIESTLATIRQAGLWVNPSGPAPAIADPDDSIFLECAEAAQAQYLVTGNTRDYPERWKDTQILTPREVFSLLAEAASQS